MARSRRTGIFGPLEPVADIRASRWDDLDRQRVEAKLQAVVAGSSNTVRSRLEELIERTDADELLLTGSTYDREALAVSDAAIVHLFD